VKAVPLRRLLPASIVLGVAVSTVQVLAGTTGWPDARALGATLDWFGDFWPPATDPDFLWRVVLAAQATVAMATLGTLGAHLLGVPLALLGNARLSLSAVGRPMGLVARLARLLVRAVALLLRSVPELVWALLLVRLTGLGPTAGILAITLGGAGLVAKVHAETLESVARAPIDAALANGAGRWQALVFHALPRCRSELLSYSTYRWECALRTSAVLGVVGAGGLGQELDLSLRFFASDQVATLLVTMVLLVLVADWLGPAGAYPRGRGQRNKQEGGRQPGRRQLHGNGNGYGHSSRRRARPMVWLLIGLLVVSSEAFRGVPSWESAAAPLARLGDFIGDFLPPRIDATRWPALWQAVRETLAMSLLGVVLAALLALPLALAARGGLRRPIGLLSSVMRAVPELVWALLLIITFGLGPLTGCLAIAVHNTGVLTRLFRSSMDALIDDGGAALRTNGVSASGAWLFGTWPRIAPRLSSHLLYRWEHAIRAAAVLGVVGAGGLGQSLHVSLGLFRLPEAAGTIAAMIALVMLVDLISFALRRRWVD